MSESLEPQEFVRQSRNAFQIHRELGRVPFAISRSNWGDQYFAVITEVVHKGKYGQAYGFPVKDGMPDAHFDYDKKWRTTMEVPNAGSYQWRLIDLPEPELERLVSRFNQLVPPHFSFEKTGRDKSVDDAWKASLLGTYDDEYQDESDA